MEDGPELGPFQRRRSWRLLKRLGGSIDPRFAEAIDSVSESLRFRLPKDSSHYDRIDAEALDRLLEQPEIFPALVRGLATADEPGERLVAVDCLQNLANKHMDLAVSLAELLSADINGAIAGRALGKLALLRAVAADTSRQPPSPAAS